jgi:hypothetical protein
MADGQNALWVKHYQIAPELFTLGYSQGCGPSACTSTCCRRGAYVDVRERERVLAHADLIRPHMDQTQTRDPTQWFEREEKLDADYPSGSCVGTAEVNGKCAFLNERGWCSLQVAATAAGMHKWALKPSYCVLYPIEILDNVVKLDFRLENQQACCSASAAFESPAFEACRDELVYLIGEDGFALLQQHYLIAGLENPP